MQLHFRVNATMTGFDSTLFSWADASYFTVWG